MLSREKEAVNHRVMADYFDAKGMVDRAKAHRSKADELAPVKKPKKKLEPSEVTVGGDDCPCGS
jgi:hypothetical protein